MKRLISNPVRLNRSVYAGILALSTALTILTPMAAQAASDDGGRDRRDDHRIVRDDRRVNDDHRQVVKDVRKFDGDRRDLRSDEARRLNGALLADRDRFPAERFHGPALPPATFERRESWVDSRIDHRQDTANTWRDLSVLGIAASTCGLLEHDPTVAFIGAAGALYASDRYEQDRRSEDELARARVALFDRGWYERDGVRFTRHDVWRDGHRFFYFAR